MQIKKRTKVITTLGPVSQNEEKIFNLFKAGMTAVRINFSHGDHQEQGTKIKIVKQLCKRIKEPISIILDTKGPEIRVGKFINKIQKIEDNQQITIYTDLDSFKSKLCSTNEMTVSYDMSRDLKVGVLILVDDGKLILEVEDVKQGVVITRAKNTHLLKENKRINLPGTKFSMPFLSNKDIQDIKFGCDLGIDFIAASFVNTAEDIQQIRNILRDKKATHVKIIAKIESQFAIDNFDNILQEADAIMVARGDLGLEIPYYNVPVVQKMMIRRARSVGKPIIIATQMLDSMETRPQPTRAEVTDVYFATELGSDATMLSGESANGLYPVTSVQVMSTINKRAEKEFYNKIYYQDYLRKLPTFDPSSREAKGKNVALRANEDDYKFAVVLSRTGKLLQAIAQLRPNTNILGVSNDPKQISQFGIVHSVFMYWDPTMFFKIKEDINHAKEVVRKFGGKTGDKFLLVQNTDITELVL